MSERSPRPIRAQISREFVKATSVAYIVMSFVGFEICWWYHQNVRALFGPIKYEPRAIFGIVIASIVFLHICQRVMEEYFASYKRFKLSLAAMFSGLNVLGAIWLALMSSFGEEILFRGAIQPFLGVWFTSVLFGLLHLDADGGICIWTFWAVLAGVLLGSVVNVTGSLWPAIVIHFCVNFIGIRGLSKIKLNPTLMHDHSVR